MVRASISRVARRSYTLTKWRSLRKLARLEGTPVVVFCMSKTASSAVVRSLQDATSQPVFKIHLLLPESVRRGEAQYRQTDRAARPRHIFHASYLMRHPPTADRPWLVVTIVREPVMRSVSEFFQAGRRLGRLHDEATTGARFERFATDQGIPRTLGWFDRELKPSLGIDVFEHPFDPTSGYGTIETPAVRMLVLRQESLEVAPGALAQLLGLPRGVPLVERNVGAEKAYAELYDTVVREVRLPPATLDLAYRSRFARHFYSSTEIDRFRARWGKS